MTDLLNLSLILASSIVIARLIAIIFSAVDTRRKIHKYPKNKYFDD